MRTNRSDVAIGIGWMAVAGICFIGVGSFVKLVGSDIPAPQAAFLRFLLGLVFVVPMLGPVFRSKLDRQSFVLFGWRGLSHSVAVLLWFFAMTDITLAEVSAMSYLTPVCVTVGAALFHGERLAYRRILAVFAALVGSVIILRPGLRELSLGHFAMLGAATFFAVSFLMAKRLTGKIEVSVIVAMLSIIVPIVLLPYAIATWVEPSWMQLFWLFLVASFATAGHYAMTLAFRYAPVSATQPVIFLQLVWASLIGAFVFGEATDVWVITGGCVIIGSVCFIIWREAIVARRAQSV